MANLNLSTNGPSISKSFQSVVSSQPPSGNAAKSPTYGQWAVYSVSAPLVNMFQQDSGGKESVLKVQATGEGELLDLIDEFSDGRVQFAFVKVKDPNTSLPKNVLIGWCGEGVPERTKGYFTSYLAAVSKTLSGYHVQITARSDRDLTAESIIQKVSDASGSKYSGGSTADLGGPPPPVSSKPAFTPTTSSKSGGFNPLAGSQGRPSPYKAHNADDDGWGQDAPPVTRTELEKVQSAYQPTKVNMRELGSQKQEPSRFNGTIREDSSERADVVKGGYQPVGKVDIAALRRQAQEGGSKDDDRPSVVKGSYEPVGKVDIAALRARAQPSQGPASPSSSLSPGPTGTSNEVIDRVEESPSGFSGSERLTSLPKPKVANRFGSNESSFTGTKAPTPGGFGLEPKPTPAAPPVGVGRTFADQGGKTPAQLWAEKKARERGNSGASENQPSAGLGKPTSPMASQTSGGGEWKSGYSGKSWGPVQTNTTGRSGGSLGQQRTGQDEDEREEAPTSPVGGVGAIRDRFKGAPPMGIAAASSNSAPSPPPLDTSSKPNAGRGIPIPGLPTRPAQPQQEDDEQEEEEAPRMPPPPAQPPRSPTPPTPEESDSPIRVAMPVGRGHEPEIQSARKEQFSPPPAMPARSMTQAMPEDDDLAEEPSGHDAARAAGATTAATSFGQEATESARPGVKESGKRALVQYDYEKAEDNELELKEGEYITNIEMVDEDWWMGQNTRGETGLFPSNYVELEEGGGASNEEHASPTVPSAPVAAAGTTTSKGPTATSLYDYEAAEDNELTFPEGAKIENLEFPDDDWWLGEYRGHSGLFPANYVQLDE